MVGLFSCFDVLRNGWVLGYIYFLFLVRFLKEVDDFNRKRFEICFFCDFGVSILGFYFFSWVGIKVFSGKWDIVGEIGS